MRFQSSPFSADPRTGSSFRQKENHLSTREQKGRKGKKTFYSTEFQGHQSMRKVVNFVQYTIFKCDANTVNFLFMFGIVHNILLIKINQSGRYKENKHLIFTTKSRVCAYSKKLQFRNISVKMKFEIPLFCFPSVNKL